MQIIPSHHPLHRRSFLHATVKFAAAAAVLPTTLLAQKTTGQEKHEPNYDVSINEGLMREHGILKRVFLIYDEVARRIDAKEDFPPQTVIDSAEIIRKFIEDYHQKLEEEHIFPPFGNITAGRMCCAYTHRSCWIWWMSCANSTRRDDGSRIGLPRPWPPRVRLLSVAGGCRITGFAKEHTRTFEYFLRSQTATSNASSPLEFQDHVENRPGSFRRVPDSCAPRTESHSG